MGVATQVNMGYTSAIATIVVLISVASPNPLYIPLAVAVVLQWDCVTEPFTRILSEYDDFTACFVTCATLPIVVYWMNGLLFLLVDIFQRPAVINRFKLQPKQGFDVFDFALIRKVVTNLLVGQLFVIVPIAFLYSYMSVRGYGFRISSELPSAAEMFHNYVWFAVGDEFIFYYGHAMLHHKLFYNRVHKIHHEFKAPIALVASYCHPLEMIISNVLPLSVMGLLLQVHLYTIAVWAVFATLGTQLHHCGYKWPWIPSWDEQPQFHDFHHESFTSNLGVMGWLDQIHGTSTKWTQAVQAKQIERVKNDPSAKAKLLSATPSLINPWQIQLFGLVALAMVPLSSLEQLP